jgi:hypothetical protein
MPWPKWAVPFLTFSWAFRQSRAKQSLIVCRLYQGGARRQNRTVPAYGLPPITAKALRAFDRFARSASVF